MHANWIRFVFVTVAEAKHVRYRDIVVAWRGTIAHDEWVPDMKTGMVPFEVDAAHYNTNPCLASDV
jgi:hypothetical protein